MPKKLKFKVLRASGEDEKYRATELDNHGPSVRGWLSNRNCSYPQEILFVLENTSILNQIQILAHHYIIPERIDVWIASDTSGDLEKDEIAFDYIGFITLSNNESTKFKCRELKTITIPFSGPTKYVKLSLYENHCNNLNVFNQVGLVAVQLIGEELNETEQNEKESITSESVSDTSQFDDLAFEMYIDSEIADLMKKLDQKKQQAVQDERFEYARKLKIAVTKLHQAGEKLGKMETAKKQAIQQEDYLKAKKKKTEIEEFRMQINRKLNIETLLEKNGIVSSNDEEFDADEENSISLLNRSSKEDNESNATDKDLSELDSKQTKSPLVFNLVLHNNIEQTPGIYESPVSPIHFEDSILTSPAFNDVPTKNTSQVNKPNVTKRNPRCPSSSGNRNYDDNNRTYRPYQHQEPKDPATTNVLSQIFLQSKLNEREKKQVTLAIHIFGKNSVEKIFSKQYADKEEGLRLLETSLRSYIDKEKEERRMADKTMYSFNKIARSATHLCHRCLRDKVYAVYSAATEVIRFFFSEFVTGRVTSAEVNRCVEQILPDLLSKSGDSTPRVHNLAIHTILSLADAPDVRKLNVIPNHLTRILTANVHSRLALSRLEMVEQLILSHGISTEKPSGMTCRILAELGISGLHHPAEAVRKMAEKILILVYKSNPRLVRRQLPPDDEVTRRNILYRHLMQEFDRIDLERRRSESRPKSTSRDTLKSDISENDIESKYSKCFGKALHKVNSEQKFKRCVFCHLESDKFTEKELNIHYWKYCPMLMRCIHCNQVIEIVAFQEHLIEECDMKALYRKCQQCLQAVNIEQLNVHRTSIQCTLMTMKNTCPLCFTELKDGEEELRIHLTRTSMGICPKHPRSKYLLGPYAESSKF